ncbi:MAG TPA: class I SAM-dependent methyltransferase [Thermoanaerobaculia bacterium]|nr:class I SAM-dependent methyltransferase [Thermoanaerobaculia bacterium]
MTSEAYDAFAYAYDQALGERFFRAVRRLLSRVLTSSPPRVRMHLDVACGTALAMQFFEQRGYRSFGVDLSLPMLQIARRRAARIAASDMRVLPLRAKFGCVTCLYDSLNHLDDLKPAFAEIARVLAGDGLFLFDVNRPEVYPDVWGNDEPFIADGPDFHLEMATKFRNGRAQALVTGWAVVNGEKVAIRERRQQRAHSEREIIDALASAGLVPREMIEFDPYQEGRAVKLFFVCQHL